MAINNFNIDTFLSEYWQKKPLLIQNAFPHFDNPVNPDELAGLACEEQIESRLITEHNQQWQLQHGPFDEFQFTQLAEKNWTLLVQAVDQWVPEVSALLDNFRFIPNWRIDDVMVSYATTGGSVGPHYDNYDVFLIQGAGTRRWQVGPKYHSGSKFQTNSEMKILEEFETTNNWVLQTGDMLYVPPLYGHWGTALDNDCMTYSIGFRAPSHSELLSDFCDHVISELNDESRYSDASFLRQNHPGELTEDTINLIQKTLQNQFTDTDKIREWLGRYLSQPKYNVDESNCSEPELLSGALYQQFEEYNILVRNPSSKFIFSGSGEKTQLHVDGYSYDCHYHLAQLLADNSSNSTQTLIPLIQSSESFNLVKMLINHGNLYFNDDDDG